MRSIEDKRNMTTRFLHHTMAAVGGFLGGYAILLRCDFFGNAQTTNWIYLVLAIVGHNLGEFLIRFIGVMLYMAGAFLYVFIVRRTKWNVKVVSLLVDMAVIVMLGFFPEDMNPIAGLYPIFFAMSLQWNSFPGAYGYVSSTIFSTNNTRQAALSFAEFCCDHKREHLHKAVFFIGSLTGFHIGVVCSYFCVKYFQIQASWFNLIFIFLAFILLYHEVKWNKRMLKE